MLIVISNKSNKQLVQTIRKTIWNLARITCS